MGETGTSKWRYLARELLHSSLHLGLLLLCAGRWDWRNAWVAVGAGMAVQVINFLVLSRYNPGLPAARSRLIQPGTKPFDKVFIRLYMALGTSITICGGLGFRFGVPAPPGGLMVMGAALYIAASAFGLWAMAVNRHFEMTVIIRADGSQELCERGPYRWVRHPGYLAAMVGMFGWTLLLGSWPAFGISFLLAGVFIWRTGREDAALQKELPGYAEYAERTPRRLVPGW